MTPQKIKIESDGNELEFVKELKVPGSKEKIVVYRYVKSHTKKGMIVEFTESELMKQLSNCFKSI